MWSLRSGSSERMVGRQTELSLLSEAWRHVSSSDQPPLVLVEGQAGIGKTRLLYEFMRAARWERLLVGHAREERAGVPFGLFRDVVARALRPAAALPEPLEMYRHPLSHLLAPLIPFDAHPADGHEHHPDELAVAALALLRVLVGDGPTLLIFEDLHWADAESLQILTRLAREQDLPVLVVGSYRLEDYRRHHPLAATLAELNRVRQPPTLHLTGLTPAEVQQLTADLLHASVGVGLAEDLHERTQGNPLFLEELVAAAAPHPGPKPGADQLLEAPLPETVREAVLRQYDLLKPSARVVLDVAAVLGERFSLALLAGVLDQDEDQLIDVLAQLTEDRLLHETAAGEFAFRHALVREAVAGHLLVPQRQRIHRRALRVLEAAPEATDHGLLVHHAYRAEDASATIRHAVPGAMQALREGAVRQALRLARLGLAHDGSEMTLLEVAARASERVGDLQAARDYGERWARAATDAGQTDTATEAHCSLAWIQWSLGSRDAAWKALNAAERAAAGSGVSSTHARVLAVKAQLHLLAGDSDEAIAFADQALDLAEAQGNRRVRAHAHVTKGTALTARDARQAMEPIEDAARLLRLAREEAEEIGDVETLARALNNSLVPGWGVATMAETHTLAHDLHRLARRYGIERLGAKLATLDAYACILEGDADAARTALARAAPAKAPIDAFFATALQALVDAETGDPDQAAALLRAQRPALDGLEAGEPHVDFAFAEAALAAVTADAGLAELALQRISAAVPNVPLGAAVAWWDVAVCTLHAGLNAPAVESWLDTPIPPRVSRTTGAAAHLEGVLSALHGNRPQAIASLAIAVRDPLGTRPACMIADAHLNLAELYAHTGELSDARAHAATAVRLLQRWPGHRLTAAKGLRRRLGEGDAPAHDLLTAREVEVCKLLAQGLTNRDIAEHLFISPKTASAHVSNILAKTGFQRRSQVTAWALQHGLDREAQPAPRQ